MEAAKAVLDIGFLQHNIIDFIIDFPVGPQYEECIICF